MKLIVKPNGPHGYMDPTSRDEVQPFRPSVVKSTPYIESLIGSGKLKLVSNELSENATDKEFAKYHAECKDDPELCLQSFLSKFGVHKDAEKEAEKEAKAEEKAKEVEAKAKAKAEADAKAAEEKAKAKAKTKE
jgi:hypothetical protein